MKVSLLSYQLETQNIIGFLRMMNQCGCGGQAI